MISSLAKQEASKRPFVERLMIPALDCLASVVNHTFYIIIKCNTKKTYYDLSLLSNVTNTKQKV